MARTVKDAAIVLGALTAEDSRDAKTKAEGRVAYQDYTQFLKADGIRGKRIGYYSQPLEEDTTELGAVMEEALDYFRSQGAEIIEIPEILAEGTGEHSFTVLKYEFKDGLNKYLAGLYDLAPARNLGEVVRATFADSVEMKYHDHELLKVCAELGDLNTPEYKEALKKMLKASRENGVDRVMDQNQLDAIVAPTGSPAWKTSLEDGDAFGVFSSSPAAISGYPNISVPMGQIDGLPVGISIFGRAWSEPVLLEIAYSFEQGTKHRFTPQFIAAEE